MKDSVILALMMGALGQIGLAVTVLGGRRSPRPVHLALSLFLLSCGVIAAGPAVAVLLPDLQVHALAASLPGWMLLAPSLWLYVEGLTAETPWRFRQGHGWVLCSPGLGLLGTVLIFSLSPKTRETIFIQGQEVGGPLPTLVILYVFALVLGWTVQSGYYGSRIVMRLAHYRRRLQALFASNDHRELRWIGWLMVVVSGLWLAAVATVIWENFIGGILFGRHWGAGLALGLVWAVAAFGLAQEPGFEGRYLEADMEPEGGAQPGAPPGAKYQRSALTADQAGRIAARLEAAMARDQLYLDPALSLHSLAQRLSISPNHVSQTLNETLGESFFDYVNRWRVLAAQPMVRSGTSTILDIALSVGFNTRSSFYKTFRRVTGLTPGAYRAANEENPKS